MRRQVSPPPPRLVSKIQTRRSLSPLDSYIPQRQSRLRSLTPPRYRHRSPPSRLHIRRDQRYNSSPRRTPSPMYERRSYTMKDTRYAYRERTRSRSPISTHRHRPRVPTPPRYTAVELSRRRSPTPPSLIESIDYGHGRTLRRSPPPSQGIDKLWNQRRGYEIDHSMSKASRMLPEDR